MRTLVQRADANDIRAYEVATAGRIVSELQPATLALIGDATKLLLEIVDACSRAPRSAPAAQGAGVVLTSLLPFERAIDATVAMTKHGSYGAVEEIGFIARLELTQRGERLARLAEAHGTVVLLGECDSSLRRVRKAFTAVDAAIAKAEAVSPLLDFTSELHTSLAVRRAYAKLRRRLLAGPEPTAETIRSRIRSVGTQIAVLIGWDVYPEMRVRDRLLLRELQQRVLAWLREGDAARKEAGLRLWRDIASSVEMFALVNRRQELVEHDRAALRDAVAAFQGDASVTPAEWQRLIPLIGLDSELDLLLAEREPPPAASVRRVLERVGVRAGFVEAGVRGPP
jgi:hypothetical protein